MLTPICSGLGQALDQPPGAAWLSTFQFIIRSVDTIQAYAAYPGRQARGHIGATVVVTRARVHCCDSRPAWRHALRKIFGYLAIHFCITAMIEIFQPGMQ